MDQYSYLALACSIVCTSFLLADHSIEAPFTWNVFSTELRARRAITQQKGQVRRRIAYIFLSAVLIVLVATCRHPTFSSLKNTGQFLALCILIWNGASVLWSEDRFLTLRRYFPVLLSTTAAFTLGTSLPFSDSILLVTIMFISFLVIGVVRELVAKTFFRRVNYRFAGTLHPNQQGTNCALLIICAYFLRQTNALTTEAFISILVIACVFLALTKSRSVLCALLATLSWWSALSCFVVQPSGVIELILGIIILLAASYFVSLFLHSKRAAKNSKFCLNTSPLNMGRSLESMAHFNGRCQLWRHLFATCKTRLIMGTGFGAFWNILRIETVTDRMGYQFRDCHSAYIESLVGTGIVLGGKFNCIEFG